MRRQWLVLAVACCPIAAFGQVKAPDIPECEPATAVRAVREARLVDALAQGERCVAYYGARKDAQHLFTGFAHLFDAQLHALLKSFNYARAEVMRAESYTGALVDITGISTVTDGFIYEQEGDTASAIRTYREAIPSSSRYALGRLALLALQSKDDAGARNWARVGAVQGDPAAMVVLGKLAELEGDNATALGYYFSAKALLDTNQATRLPMFYLESQRIDLALARLGDPARMSGARIDVTNGRRKFYNARGEMVGEEKWPGVLFLPEVEQRQRRYNEWAQQNLVTSLPGIETGPQYPRDFSPPDLLPERRLDPVTTPVVRIRVPKRVEPTGVLDINTAAIGFYKLAAEWAQLCKDAQIAPGAFESTVPASRMDSAAPAAYRAALTYQLRETLTSLDRLYGFLRGVRLRTSTGKIYDAAAEGESRQIILDDLQRRLTRVEARDLTTLPRKLFDDPPDYLTAHVPSEQLTPEFVAELVNRERDVRAGLVASRALFHLSRATGR